MIKTEERKHARTVCSEVLVIEKSELELSAHLRKSATESQNIFLCDARIAKFVVDKTFHSIQCVPGTNDRLAKFVVLKMVIVGASRGHDCGGETTSIEHLLLRALGR